jgi:carboxymethylenebutenolidase
MRRLALVGVAAGIGASLLSACGTSGPGSGAAAEAAPPGREPETPRGSDVTLAGPSGQLRASWAAPTGQAKASVLVIHDNQGLTPHFADVVGRFAGAGYATLCVDLLSGQNAPAAPADPAQAPRALLAEPPDKLLANLRAGLDEIGRRVPGVKNGAVGFGFGGGQLWQLLAAGEDRLAAAVNFYGEASDNLDFSKTHAAVLALYPADDRKLSESQDNADQAMLNANLVHNSVLYAGSVAGFFDDTSPRYNPTAAAQAWQATLDWFGRNL